MGLEKNGTEQTEQAVSNAKSSAKPGTKLDLWKISPSLLAICIDAMGFGLVYPILSAIFSDPHSGILSAGISEQWRFFFIGLGYAVYPLFMFFGSSLMGELSDVFGRKRVLSTCVLGLSASYFMMAAGAALPSLVLLIVGRGLGGLMAGCQGIAQAAISDLSTPENKAINMSIMSIAYSAGIVIGPVIGGATSSSATVSFFSYWTPFALVGLLSFACYLWILVKFKETTRAARTQKISVLLPFKVIIEAATDQRVRLLCVIFLLMQIGYSLYFQMILLQLQHEFHYSTLGLGLFSGLIGTFFVIGLTVVVRALLRRRTAAYTAQVGLVVAGVAQVASGLVHVQAGQWVLAMVIGAFDMVAYTTLLTVFSDAVPEDKQGWVLGVSGSVMAIGWVATGLLANLDPVLGDSWLIFLGGVFWLVSCALMTRYVRKRDRGTALPTPAVAEEI